MTCSGRQLIDRIKELEMSLDNKVRPTFTIRDLQLIAGAIDEKIVSLVSSGATSSPVLLNLVKIRAYCESFKPQTNDAEVLLAAYLRANKSSRESDHAVSEINIEALAHAKQEVQGLETRATMEQLVIPGSESPIENAELTDEQKFDLLSLRKDAERTEAENTWFMNVGTLIKMRRAMGATKIVKNSDL